ncbi:MAG: lysostaphin resistance A-like protein [Clostridium sp.]|uniref:CPBP family intramembrane glutamic endopeptidase n=1 Tax=Clostridium sp. TaxID=1506 RepID=UPI003F37B428
MKYIKIILVPIGILLLFNVLTIIVRLFNINILNLQGAVVERTGIIETIIVDIIVVLILFSILFYYKKNAFKMTKMNKFFKAKNLYFIIIMILASMFIGVIISGVICQFIPRNKAKFNSIEELRYSALGLMFTIIIAPILEEIIFRGILFNYLRRYCNIVVAIVIQALTFGIFHGDFFQGIYAVFMGIALAIIYMYTDSLWGNIIGHGLANLINMILIFKVAVLFFIIISIVCIIIIIKNRKSIMKKVLKTE